MNHPNFVLPGAALRQCDEILVNLERLVVVTEGLGRVAAGSSSFGEDRARALDYLEAGLHMMHSQLEVIRGQVEHEVRNMAAFDLGARACPLCGAQHIR